MKNNEYTLKHQFLTNEKNLKQKHYIIDKIRKLTKCDDQVKSQIAQIS